MNIGDVKPNLVSIRKLKKYYVRKIKLPILFIPTKDIFHIFIPERYANIEVPNLYINKKIIERYITQHNRYNAHGATGYKIPTKPYSFYLKFICSMSDAPPRQKKITFYYIFDTESEYLKWKLKI